MPPRAHGQQAWRGVCINPGLVCKLRMHPSQETRLRLPTIFAHPLISVLACLSFRSCAPHCLRAVVSR
eukprot:5434669-Alexandrium_andersonii.AAC.1